MVASETSALFMLLAVALVYANTQERAVKEIQDAHSQVVENSARLQEQNALLSALVETERRYHLELDFPALVQVICEAIRESLGWGYVGMTVRVPWRGGEYLYARAGLGAPEMRTPELGVDPVERMRPLFREKFRISGSYFIDHRHADEVRAIIPLISSMEPPHGGENAWHADDVLLIPIQVRGEVLGIIVPDEPRDGRGP